MNLSPPGNANPNQKRPPKTGDLNIKHPQLDGTEQRAVCIFAQSGTLWYVFVSPQASCHTKHLALNVQQHIYFMWFEKKVQDSLWSDHSYSPSKKTKKLEMLSFPPHSMNTFLPTWSLFTSQTGHFCTYDSVHSGKGVRRDVIAKYTQRDTKKTIVNTFTKRGFH